MPRLIDGSNSCLSCQLEESENKDAFASSMDLRSAITACPAVKSSSPGRDSKMPSVTPPACVTSSLQTSCSQLSFLSDCLPPVLSKRYFIHIREPATSSNCSGGEEPLRRAMYHKAAICMPPGWLGGQRWNFKGSRP